MNPASRRHAHGRALAAVTAGVLATVVAAATMAQAPSIYRYVGPDGRIVYSDHIPPPNAKDVESKRLIQNYIETDKMSGETQRAQQRFPVTLYSFGCGEVCDRAEALLNKRGVPFTLVNVQESSGAAKLKQLTGELQAPVLQAGDKLIAKGFNENLWQTLLDDAGYPKTPAPRRGQPPQANVKGSVPAPSAAAPAPPATAETGGGYPKN
jgi:glutaredoxin